MNHSNERSRSSSFTSNPQQGSGLSAQYAADMGCTAAKGLICTLNANFHRSLNPTLIALNDLPTSLQENTEVRNHMRYVDEYMSTVLAKGRWTTI